MSYCFCRNHSTWSQRDQDLLAQMSQQFVSDASAITKDCMYEYMAALLPENTVPDIAGHNEWYVSSEHLIKRALVHSCKDAPHMLHHLPHGMLDLFQSFCGTKQFTLYLQIALACSQIWQCSKVYGAARDS